LLSESREFSISTNLFNQTLEQLDDANRAAALQAGNLVVFRVSGEDSKTLAPSFDTTPTQTLVGEEPVRAVMADPLTHLTRHGHPLLGAFIADYLMPLEGLVRQVNADTHPFILGCAMMVSRQVLEGQRRLNDVIAYAMRTGKEAVFIDPLALFVLAASAGVSTDMFANELHYELGYVVLKDFYAGAYRYGKPDYLKEVAALEAKRKERAAKPWWQRLFMRVPSPPPPSFVRMLKALRQAMALLAKEPLRTDTGLFQPKYQLRTYQDQENLVANELSQLPNYHAKVRLLTTEYTIRTNPAPPLISEREVEARIRTIKERMAVDGVTLPAAAIEEQVRKRHELLRQRPPSDDPPPTQTTGRRVRR
jgi:hypothetical protein